MLPLPPPRLSRLLLSLAVFLALSSFSRTQEAGSGAAAGKSRSCQHEKLRVPGVCKDIRDCPYAVEQRKQNEYPQQCKFGHSWIPVVCCPETVVPQSGLGVPQAGVPQTGVPQTGVPETGVPQTGVPQTGVPQTGVPQTGVPQTGVPVTGVSPAVVPQSGAPVGVRARQKCQDYVKYVRTLVNGRMTSNKCFNANQSQEIEVEKLVVGGVPASPKEFPHMALLGYGNPVVYSCGGTLIAPKFVLTAAHCLSRGPDLVSTVRLGDLDRGREDDDALVQNVKVARFYRHPGFKAKIRYDDIALLLLERDVDMSEYVRPACLHVQDDGEGGGVGGKQRPGTPRTGPGDPVFISGWGVTDFDNEEGNSELLKARLFVDTNQKCNNTYSRDPIVPRGILNTQICASAKGKDACRGDSGGPLQVFTQDDPYCMYHVLGVVSIGRGCAGGAPGIYSRVSAYVSWIEGIVWADG